LPEISANDLSRHEEAFRSKVAYGLQSFLNDATSDVVASRLGLTANDELWKLMILEAPETTGAALRNDLDLGRERAPVVMLAKEKGLPADRRLYRYRAMTASGRLTSVGSSMAVRRQQVLMTDDGRRSSYRDRP
jgi:hypothetical protein